MNRKEIVEKMLDADFGTRKAGAWRMGEKAIRDYTAGMDAALSVAIDELLKEPTQDEQSAACRDTCAKGECHQRVSFVITFRRAALERVKTPEERVTVETFGTNSWQVKQDGVRMFGFTGLPRCDAETYRLGLIQQLKDSNGR